MAILAASPPSRRQIEENRMTTKIPIDFHWRKLPGILKPIKNKIS